MIINKISQAGLLICIVHWVSHPPVLGFWNVLLKKKGKYEVVLLGLILREEKVEN